jgi:MoCo/4Fe-4S cofactor protein with predicted Tat translocation signal
MNTDDQNGKPHREAVCPSKRHKLDLKTVRARIAETKGPEFWRSLEELAGSAEFQEMLHREFPKGASEWLDSVSRRGFLKLMGASLAMAGMTACTKQPLEPIVPYVRQPEEVIPGRPLFFATAFTLSGYASPILVESHLYRPTKIEGNDQHPASLGGTDVFAQASILEMYDPDRSQTITYLGDVRTWGDFVSAIRGPLSAQKAVQGAGMRILTRTISSPTLVDQLHSVLRLYPQAKWHVYEPINRDNVYAGAQMAFGQPVETQYKLENADVILSLDADFLYAGFPGFARYARDFAKRRDPDSGKMNRLYVVESTPTSTGAKADHRLPLRSSEIERFVIGLASPEGLNDSGTTWGDDQRKFFDALVKDLEGHRGSSLVIAGDHQTAVVHALSHMLNQALGNVGRTVVYTDPVNANPTNQSESLRDLVGDMRAGKVDLLVILGENPAYDAPADLGFGDALINTKIPLRVHLGLYQDETAELCHWHVNEAQYLEAWGDARAYDGTVSIVQPLIAPLYGGKSMYEMAALLVGQSDASGHDIVQAYWRQQHPGVDFEAFWRKSLHEGWIAGTTFAARQFTSRRADQFLQEIADQERLEVQRQLGLAADVVYTLQVPITVEINFRCDPSIYDGRFSNNGWLQELPKPMTKMTWDNPVLISPKMAERMGLRSEDMVQLELNGTKVTAPVWIQAGHPDNSVTVFLGYGRRRAGRAGTGAGFDMYPLRNSATPWFTAGLKITKTGGTYKLATTQGMQSIETPNGDTRPLVRTASLEEYHKEPTFAKEEEPPRELTLYPGYDYQKEPYAWGMAIDMNACVGCNNCIVACQSENNIAVVGKEQVVLGRHMHWLRVDTYYQGDRANPKAYFQPVPCMHCENAPCEVVCPVGATVHSTEGLNDMVYNRCVGTRYCSNNCPYKVRRFNFLLFQDWDTPQYKMMRNPDVTVRSRGVMEKCTYCVQRINEHRIDSEREDRKIQDGELQTACQQSCPANAIVFGNINDPNSRVSKLKASARNYGLLADLNTRPRTTYLAEIRNPNPELKG